MPENNKTEEFLLKLAPCIERGELEACVEEAARVAKEMGIGAEELLDLSGHMGIGGNHEFVYVLSLAAAHGLEGDVKARAYNNAGLAAQSIGKLKEAEYQYKKTIVHDSNFATVYYNYANLLIELNRKNEAEKNFKKAIEIDPDYAEAYFNYGYLLKDLNRKTEAEEYFKKAIHAKPKLAIAHYNYALLLVELDRIYEAKRHFEKAIESDPKDADSHNAYAILLQNLDRKTEAEKHYKKAIELDTEYADAYNNYANLLIDLKRLSQAEENYKKAIEVEPKYEAAYYNYANFLRELNRAKESEKHYKKAIELNPKSAEAHAGYSLLLIARDRENSWKEIELASDLFKETGDTIKSHFAKAWFYQLYSEKNFSRKKYSNSSEDAYKAGEEYLKAAEIAEGNLKYNLTLQGNILLAKSFVRKIPVKSWYKWIYYRFGENPHISELTENLKNAAQFYEKASQCPVGERKDVCNACFSSMNVFSETLGTMSAFIKGDDAEINTERWSNSLDYAYKIYTEKKLSNGAALVDTLRQLIKCVNELAEHRKIGLHIQEERLGKCYINLRDVSEKLDGALKVIADHSIEAIRDYAKKQGMGFVGEDAKKSVLSNWIKVMIGAVVTIILGIIANRLFSWNLDLKLLSLIKSLIQGNP